MTRANWKPIFILLFLLINLKVILKDNIFLFTKKCLFNSDFDLFIKIVFSVKMLSWDYCKDVTKIKQFCDKIMKIECTSSCTEIYRNTWY